MTNEASTMLLPDSADVDVGVLSGLFSKRTNSYKYLFFLSLLDQLEHKYLPDSAATNLRISFRDLAVGMLANAWYPRVYFHLAFGVQDKVIELLDPIERSHPIAVKFDIAGRKRLLTHLHNHCDERTEKDLLRYVVQRLLRGFFSEELRGVKDALVDEEIILRANAAFEVRRPLYRVMESLYGGASYIELHRDWFRYLKINFSLVRGWAAWQWCRYMQSRNRNVPAISEKLFPPSQRSNFAAQKGYWRALFEGDANVVCIYSGDHLTPENSDLDHFVPWKFVMHDQVWNLVPVSRKANHSKSDALPSLEYLGRFIDMQSRGLSAVRRKVSPTDWTRLTECYVTDLGIREEAFRGTEDELRTALVPAYESIVPPLLTLAGRLGFQSNWVYRKRSDPSASRSGG